MNRRKAIKHKDMLFAPKPQPRKTLEERFAALPEPVQAILGLGFLFLALAIAGTLTYPY